MKRDAERYGLFARRALILGGVKAGLVGVLGARLYWLHAVDGEKYKVLAEENRINTRPLTPARGLIFDRNGTPLATNRSTYRVTMTIDQGRAALAMRQAETVLRRLERVFAINATERERILAQVRRSRALVPITIRENLSWEEVARIEFNTPDLPGVAIDPGWIRHYPYAEPVSHVVGYVGRVSEDDLRDSDDPVLELPGMRIGKKGIEKGAETMLRGRPGGVQVEVNARGRVVRELDRVESEAGSNIQLTIDLPLQQFVAERLAEQSASAVVMDAITGDILALASTPSFDSNAFARTITSSEWRDLLNNPRKPLLDKAVQGQYPPGSTYKMVTALAALESRTLGLSERLFCGGFIELPGKGQKKYCWIHPGGHGWLNVTEALEQSCDCFFYEAARRATVDRIAEVATKLGFGASTQVGLPEEADGLQPTRAWKRDRGTVPWGVGDTYNLGIGQGAMLATPLQLALMTARIANGGHAVQPRLIAASAGPTETLQALPVQTKPASRSLGFRPQNLRAIQTGMDMVVNSPSGTAHGARIPEAHLAMAGKTGTAQVKRITESERRRRVAQADLPWHLRHHALFVGYAPTDAPRYTCAVVVEHGIGGSVTAAPLARDILRETQKIDPARRPERFESAGHDGDRPVEASTTPPAARQGRGSN